MNKLPSIALIFAALLSAPLVMAAQVVSKYAVEKNSIPNGVGSGERLYGVEYVERIKRAIHIKGEIGVWISKQSERHSSLFASAGGGYRVQLDSGLFFEAFLGPGFVHSTDAHSSSHIEIMHDINAGFMKDGFGIGLGYKHISNAGLVPPNLGRDFAGMRFVIPIGGGVDER